MDIETWKAHLEGKFEVGFIASDFNDCRYQQVDLIISTPIENQKRKVDNDEVVILEAPVTSPKSQAFSSQLGSELERHSIIANRVKWNRNLYSLKGKRCISLLELETPILPSLSAKDFTAMKTLVLQSSSLLWVSSATDPAGNLAPGMARSIRNEMPDMELCTLQVQSESLDSPESLISAITRLATVFVEDDEFLEEDGILKVSRVVEDTMMNQLISASKPTDKGGVETMSLKQANGPRKLAIQNQGMLDTLCYELDDVASCHLADDEVEIKVKATGLK